MSENTLFDAIKSLEQKYKLSSYQIKSCDDYFSRLEVGELVYAGHIKSKLVVSITEAYSFLEELRKQGFLQTLYEVYCTNCSRSKGIFLKSISEFNPSYHCDFCGEHLNSMDNLIVLYKVIKV